MLEQMKRAAMFSTSEKRVEGEAYELSSDEGADEQEARALDEGPAAWSGHEDEGLADDAHLKVDSGGELIDVVPNGPHSEHILQDSSAAPVGWVFGICSRDSTKNEATRHNGSLRRTPTWFCVNAEKAYREKLGVVNEPEEEHGHEGEVGPNDNPSGKDLIELPRVGDGRRLHPVLGNGHDGAVVEDGNDEHHERWEVELPDQGEEKEPEHNTDCDGDRVDRVVLHPLEDGPAGEHGADYHAQPGLGEDNVRGAPCCIGGVGYCNPDVCLL